MVMARFSRRIQQAAAGIAIIPDNLNWDWSDVNTPWAYSSTSQFTEDWPSGVTIVNIQTGSSDFYTNLANTVNAASGRVVVQLGDGVYHLNKFRMIGSSGSPLYSFGFWFPKLQGFLGNGPDKTFIQFDADATTVDTNGTTDRTADAHTAMEQMDPADFAPILRGFCRIDGTNSASPVLLAGLTFRAADQLPLTAKAAGNYYVPQPSAHNGIVIYAGSYARIQYVRFQAAGRAMSSAPPFECANIGSQYATIDWRYCEFDGRRSVDIDPARPRRCAPVMLNNETYSNMEDCWMHHSNLSRYAANDENRNTQGIYNVTRCKSEQITNTRNTDTAINNGNTLGAYTNACLFGWESCNGTINVTDCIMSVDNPYTDSGISQDLQLTSVGSRNPQGGRMNILRGEYRNTGFPSLDGYLTMRVITNTYWYMDGLNTTVKAVNSSGQRLQPYVHTASWPPSTSTLNAAGVTPQTHYIVRSS